MKLLAAAMNTPRQLLAGLLMLSGIAWAQEAAAPVFSLMPEDVPKVVILAAKPGQILLEVTYSKPKQAEFLAMTQNGLPKKIGIALNGKTVSERTVTAPATGHSLKFPMDSLDSAFALAEALLSSASTLAPGEVGTPDTGAHPPTFTLLPDDVTKIAVFGIKPRRIFLEISCTSDKRAELAALIADSPPAQAIRFMANGAIIAERPVAAGEAPRALRFDMPSLPAALSHARFLMNASLAPTPSVRVDDAPPPPSTFQ